MAKIINLKKDVRMVEEVPRPGEGGISVPSPVRCGYIAGTYFSPGVSLGLVRLFDQVKCYAATPF